MVTIQSNHPRGNSLNPLRCLHLPLRLLVSVPRYSKASTKRTLMPEKKRKVNHAGQHSSNGSKSVASASLARPAGKGAVTTSQYTKPAPSNILSKLSKLSGGPPKPGQEKSIQRSHSLLARSKPEPSLAPSFEVDATPSTPPQPISNAVPGRDDRLAIIEQLEVGPIDHKPPPDDPHFERLEPNSGIRLSYVSQLKLLDG